MADHGEMEHIKVYLRIRPATSEEKSQGMDDGCISVESDQAVVLCAPPMSQAFRNPSHQRQRFTFTHVFPPGTSQKQFFDGTVHSLVSEFVSGQNCLVFTYGVTNSGKTYTIQGDQQANTGILPRCLDVIFGSVSSRLCTNTTLKPVMFAHVAQLTADQVRAHNCTDRTRIRVTTHLEKLQASGNLTVVREKSGKMCSCMHKIWPVGSQENHRNCCHQMSDFKAKMHQS